MEEINTDQPGTLFTKFKCWVFMKLGYNLWKYIIFHEDFWGRGYGVSFTHDRGFSKKLKYDMEDLPDDLEDGFKEKK